MMRRPAEVEKVAETLMRQRRVVIAVSYLFDRVPTAGFDAAKAKAAAICDREEALEEIRKVLGRDLDASELGKYENLDEIAPAVEAAALRIATPGRDILASKYLRLRVPSANYFEAKLTLKRICERERTRRQ